MSEPNPPLAATYELQRPVEVYVVRRPRQRYWLHAALLLATVFTTLVVGARMEYNFQRNQPAFSLQDDSMLPWFHVGWAVQQPSHLLLGVPFAATLMLILLAHEMGHYLYCLRYGVHATLPFFIPAPTLIGTFGAFIRIRSPIRSRTALFDIGIAGPIAGFVVAVAVLIVGLGFSKPLPAGMPASDIELGYPLIFHFIHRLLAMTSFHPQIQALPLSRVYLHPTAVAAWVGMFATALNLLPGGQLDGGHIVYALAPGAHKHITRITVLVLLTLGMGAVLHGFQTGPGNWLLWSLLVFVARRHPPVIPWPGLSRTRKLLAVAALAMLVVTFMPTPLRIVTSG